MNYQHAFFRVLMKVKVGGCWGVGDYVNVVRSEGRL